MKKCNVFLAATLLVAGCNNGKPISTKKDAVQIAKHSIYRQANELGMVPILEYHRFGTQEERWTRTYSNFRKDLEFLYHNGYVLVSVNDFARGKIDIPAGKKAVVITFDDSSPEQFRFQTKNGQIVRDAKGNPKVHPDSAVGVLDRFALEHPDFGKAAAFYVLPNAFEEAPKEKLKYLYATGRQIGNHTYGHANLSQKSASAIQKELSRAQLEVQKSLPGVSLETLALPYGAFPKDSSGVQAVMQGLGYRNHVVLLVGANPSYSPFDRRFAPRETPRIQAIDDEWKRWFNRTPGSVKKTKEVFTPYVSDGDPMTIHYPRKEGKFLGNGYKGHGQANEDIAQAEQKVATSVSPSPAASSSAKVCQVHPGYGIPLPKGGNYVDGKIVHTVQSGEVLESISVRYLKFTDYYIEEDLRAAIRGTNTIRKGGLSVGQRLTIPKVRQTPPRPKIVPRPKNFVAKGLYMTATSAGCNRMFRLIRELKPKGINTVIFDAKDMSGIVSYDSKVPLARKIGAVSPYLIRDLPKMIDHLHRQGIHVVARMTLFYDRQLATHRSDLTVRSKATGRPWIEQGSVPTWVDPSLKEVQDYNLALAKEMIANGVDEIQFDYIRFPAMGRTRDCKYHFDPSIPKHTIITGFLKRAYNELKPLGALISIDVYGVVAWDQGIDVVITGQKIEDMCKYTDVICPMLYSSHFYGNFDHKAYPPDEPYYFVSQGVLKVRKKTLGSNVTIRPWLQAFAYRVHHYNPSYINLQLKAAQDTKSIGWSFWDAQNQYGMASKAL